MTIRFGSINFQGSPEEVNTVRNFFSGIVPAHTDHACTKCDKSECDICDVMHATQVEPDEDALVE